MIEYHENFTSTLAFQAIPTFYFVELIVFLSIFLIYKTKRIDLDNYALKIFSFTFLYQALYNIVSDVAHLGLRTQIAVCALTLYSISQLLFKYNAYRAYRNKLTYLLLAIGFIVFWYEVRKITELIPWTLICTPLPFVSITDITILEVLEFLGIK